MSYKSGHCISGGGHYNPHTLPPVSNPGATDRGVDKTLTAIDELLEPHEGNVRVAQGLEKDVQMLAPDPLELCYLGIKVIKDFPDAYPRYSAVMQGYKVVGLIDQKIIDGVMSMVEKNREKPSKVEPKEYLSTGIGAPTVANPVIAQHQLQPQS